MLDALWVLEGPAAASPASAVLLFSWARDEGRMRVASLHNHGQAIVFKLLTVHLPSQKLCLISVPRGRTGRGGKACDQGLHGRHVCPCDKRERRGGGNPLTLGACAAGGSPCCVAPWSPPVCRLLNGSRLPSGPVCVWGGCSNGAYAVVRSAECQQGQSHSP
jgi:hypothetical protein